VAPQGQIHGDPASKMTEAIKNDMHQSTENSQDFSLEGTLKPAPISLRPLKPKFLNDLIRIGARGDGGYVLNKASVRHSQYLLSFGINDEWSFESEFLTRRPQIKIFCFDHSVSKGVFRARMRNAIHDILSFKPIASGLSLKRARLLQMFSDLRHWAKIHSQFSRFVSNQNVKFYSKGISNEKNDQFITFTEAFQLISPAKPPENSVFVKIDIEQSEYRVLPAILAAQHYISGMVVEFHDLDILWGKFLEIMQQLTRYFEITHIHGNNYGGLIPNSDIPRVLEITFLKRALIPSHQNSPDVTYPIPHLDFPNDVRKEDYRLTF
jgi:hypothetical protein